jgi:hypothetical protein
VLALKHRVHFVGDGYRPLHSADETDRGGKDRLIAGKFSQSKSFTPSGTRKSSRPWVRTLQPFPPR